MAINHRHPRKLYNTLADDLVPYGSDGKVQFDARFDLAMKLRSEKEHDPSYYKRLADVSGINKKRISQIARMAGEDPEHWEIAAIKDGMRLMGKERRSKNKGR